MLRIREAKLSDFKGFYKVAVELHKNAAFKSMPMDRLYIHNRFNQAVIRKDMLTLVVADDESEEIYGAIIAQTFPSFWGNRVSNDVFTYCTAKGWVHKLLKRYKEWALMENVEMINVGILAGLNPRYERLIQRLGFNKVGGTFSHFPMEK